MLPADLRGHVRLACVPGIGSRLRRLLLERFGTPEGVFAASPAEIASVGRIGRRLATALPTLADDTTANDVIALCRQRSVDILLEGTAAYPALLSRIDDPPGLLFVRGTLLPQDSLSVAIVGARHATPYGLKVAEQLGAALARAGYTVVSGLARGIDAAAHRGALRAGGRTIAVLGSGVLSVYPPEHADLADWHAVHRTNLDGVFLGCKHAILSKVDEAVKLAPALDALIRHQLVLRGITNGQRVPEDFARAHANELVATSMRAHTKSAFDPSTLDMDFYFTESSSGMAHGALHA
jgi:hypothetical protein